MAPKSSKSNSTDLPPFQLWCIACILVLTSDQGDSVEVWLRCEESVILLSLATVLVAITFTLSRREQKGIVSASIGVKFSKPVMSGSSIMYSKQRSNDIKLFIDSICLRVP